MKYHVAEASDIEPLAQLNEQFIHDTGHRSQLSAREIEPFIRRCFKKGFRAVLFEDEGEVVAYALYRSEEPSDLMMSSASKQTERD
jgi:hypothetical protein